MKFTLSRVAAGAAVSVIAALTLAGCADTSTSGGSGSGEAASSDDLSITLLPKNLGNPYFDASEIGASAAAEALGAEFEQVGPTEATPDGQVSYINTAAQQGRSALVVSANDPNAICDALNEARDNGVTVVTFDSDTNPDCRDLFINQADTAGIAKVQGDLIAEQIGEEGEVAILSASANATNQNTWNEAFIEYVNETYPDIEIIDTVYGDDEDQKSFDQTAALLQSNPDLAGIVSPTTVGIAAAARYLSDSDAKGEVALTGLGTPNQMREFIEDGTVEAFALWNPEDLGTLATYAAAAVATGEIEGAEGDTFSAGDLGEFTVGADGVVLLGDPFVFDADNIDEFQF
ncbi:rhamnose ABC transporter substrate-binding protein [Microbacterium excoecariae]|uniref:rhamnose ABC transporter substrate-binding protein n=1 Tax=Microbacterium excoecariae TaxID=2715210 RepID=UPI00197BBF0F|nr:rhamnose ABC transporter substrate-binding protein [Microbacterium excoecariae]NHI16562.1 rhamnose ABC transporter substrate-binding protein [Microbacterium excoecariae]